MGFATGYNGPVSDTSVNSSAERYTVPALERGLRLLGEFSRHSSTLSAPELARRLVFRVRPYFECLALLRRPALLNALTKDAVTGSDWRCSGSGLSTLRHWS